jgi:hypothetical protein
MSTTPLGSSKLVALLRAEGLTVVEVDGPKGPWETHNRRTAGPWGPVSGVMIHHTVTSGSARTVTICRDGYSSLPGPLCHGVITKDGRVHLVGHGRANHAGGGDPAVLAVVKAQTYATRTRPPAPQRGNADGIDGNRAFYGFECENMGDGKDPWPAAQLLAIERVSAAICRHHGWNECAVIGHAEWSNDKIDPRGFTMASMRTRIKNRLKPKAKPPVSVVKVHKVAAGDTLSSIVLKYRVIGGLAKVRALNPQIKGDLIRPGDKVRYQ